MREIKFRAKGQTDKKWHYGLLVFLTDEVCHIKDKSVKWICDSKTVGQYIGSKDKEGEEIYEGDILKRTSTIKQWERELFDEIIGKVTIKIGMTYLVGKRKHGYLDEELKISNYKALLLSPDLFEVIENIYENPELLEEEE